MLVWLKSAEFAPLKEIELMVTVVAPELATVRFIAALWEPTLCEAKVRLGGDTAMVAGDTPTPLSRTLCGLPLALSLKFRLALALPAVCGAKLTPTVQLA